ncbi:hypothetical protein DIJ64_10255 [Mycobacterium leprae]|uniref:Uncharacterized protein n=1 Tax=Mycobacterium leprae TaxID=1769 RepID=A0AAD0P574_MYCLR|nr:hypothetical protein [Mycobacterium leprae]AWV48305.1 hypothetical protein DIJ64_10255 [Mycobacterium leprae]OAR20671.1 hypothetical protein A8144_09780 [Mycobacterium leprae 3125609]OAX70836.1 hypothetical protein A3216_09565 [Mycobacterium leprae 7935681]
MSAALLGHTRLLRGAPTHNAEVAITMSDVLGVFSAQVQSLISSSIAALTTLADPVYSANGVHNGWNTDTL